MISRIKEIVEGIDPFGYKNMKKEWREQNAFIDSLQSIISKLKTQNKNLKAEVKKLKEEKKREAK